MDNDIQGTRLHTSFGVIVGVFPTRIASACIRPGLPACLGGANLLIALFHSFLCRCGGCERCCVVIAFAHLFRHNSTVVEWLHYSPGVHGVIRGVCLFVGFHLLRNKTLLLLREGLMSLTCAGVELVICAACCILRVPGLISMSVILFTHIASATVFLQDKLEKEAKDKPLAVNNRLGKLSPKMLDLEMPS